MFDRSGSMAGEPLASAKAAVISGLQLLTPADQFTVVAFDHEQLWWTGGFLWGGVGWEGACVVCCALIVFLCIYYRFLLSSQRKLNTRQTHANTTEPLCYATPDNVSGCIQWVRDNVSARGTTDIMAPTQRAMRMLQVRAFDWA
jgi:hypothetical protein